MVEGFPLYSEDLLKDLEERFPARCPDITMSDREIWMYAGKRAVVEHLLARKKAQEEGE
jgi:hypothetical protein